MVVLDFILIHKFYTWMLGANMLGGIITIEKNNMLFNDTPTLS